MSSMGIEELSQYDDITVDLLPQTADDFLWHKKVILTYYTQMFRDRHLALVNFLKDRHSYAVLRSINKNPPPDKKPAIVVGLKGDNSYFWCLPDERGRDPQGRLYIARRFYRFHQYQDYLRDIHVTWLATHIYNREK